MTQPCIENDITYNCFHCHEPLYFNNSQKENKYQVEILGALREMCCPGCQAVAQTIVNSGLTSYYEHRTKPGQKAELIPEQLQELKYYDHNAIQEEFVIDHQNSKSVTLSLEGVTCVACSWLIERKISQQSGVIDISVNISTSRAQLTWNDEKVKLSHLLYLIQQLGYSGTPFEPNHSEELYHKQMKTYLYRIGIAGLATMQVMFLAFSLYFGVFGDLDPTFKNYLRWLSLFFSTPVLLYSAQPFYLNAWNGLKAKTLGMDLPVSIALLFAYSASVYATLFKTGEVYFESVSMFTFLLLSGRFLEMRARHRSAAASANLLKLIPAMARMDDGTMRPAKQLISGDIIRVHAGEHIAADGLIIEGKSGVDESMLTGESELVIKQTDDSVFAGTINHEANLAIKVTAPVKSSMICQILKLQDKAQTQKIKVSLIADRIARYFVFGLLIISTITYFYWLEHDPENAFWIMLSVLVGTCPCALSLATPTAITCATNGLNRLGLLITKGNIFETFHKVDHVLLDKTGTLTEGIITIKSMNIVEKEELIDPSINLKQMAASLENHTSHPIAKAFIKQMQEEKSHLLTLTDVTNHIGQGVEATYFNQKNSTEKQIWKIGHPKFALNQLDQNRTYDPIILSCNGFEQASFNIEDPIREQSYLFIKQLKEQGIQTTILTGDQSHIAIQVAKQLNIDHLASGLMPNQKLEYIYKIKKDNPEQITLMIGDGINDAPVLAAADVSIAMGGGSDIAKSSADLILLNDNLLHLIIGKLWMIKTNRIIKQNLLWAFLYNLVIIPLAMAGLVAPYFAVLGMSTSSLIVILNSLRLLKDPKKE